MLYCLANVGWPLIAVKTKLVDNRQTTMALDNVLIYQA